MTEFAEVKTQDLSGAALDWAVAQAEQVKVTVNGAFSEKVFIGSKSGLIKGLYKPCADWSHGGLLIEKYAVEFEWITDATIRAEVPACASSGYGNKHLTAACRAIVASVLGETVSVPKELLS
ncbi:phage protein NinX family protein [Pseudomonas fluorescens]|uniref:phage protein NinX family protein n=1 Tax=Pseudomonas fluorescens TaxID=294 RepID=UPI00058A770C|nr:phage protein NinX family protein [Pseudomonas fluorescens]CEL30236.1 hypothetical protein SRM1_03594 [Pseudomonas fluorescens]